MVITTAHLSDSKKISNNKELAQYIRNESAKVVQQTLYEYVRNRMGTLYVKMHDDQKFIDSLNIATWNIYTVALQDLTLYSHSVIENLYRKEFSNLELEIFYKEILDSEIENGLKQELLDDLFPGSVRKLCSLFEKYFLNNILHL